jgi:UrcA family protein
MRADSGRDRGGLADRRQTHPNATTAEERPMNRPLVLFSATSLGFLGALASGTLCAQQSEQRLEEITVVAPRLVTRESVGRTASGGKVELILLTRHVSYADLNLAMHADVLQLEQRVNDVAKDSCEQLAKMYPLSDPNTPDCVREAVANAKAQMDAAVSAATSSEDCGDTRSRGARSGCPGREPRERGR